MGKYVKRPVEVEARQLAYFASNWREIYSWIESNTLGSFDCVPCIEGDKPWPESGISIDPRDGRMVIATLEGGHWVNLGDWVIRGTAGEFYPCKPDIFEQTYEPVEA